MASYYGYVERQADSNIDWAQAAKGMTDMLSEQNKIREDKKDALDEGFRNLSKELTANPLGESKQLSDYSMGLAGNAQGYLLNLNKMLKSGQIKLNDYLTRSQNLSDSTKSVYETLKVYQDRAKAVKERRAKGESSSFETKAFEEAEGFADFSNTYAYINPETGAIWNAKMQKQMVDGKEIYTIPKTPTGELQPVFLLKKRMETNYDAFNMDEAAKNRAASFGDQIHVLEVLKSSTKQQGMLKEILDPMNRESLKTLPENMRKYIKNMEDAETKLIESDLVNPNNTLSILLDQVQSPTGGFYDTTYDEAEAASDPNKILMRNKGGIMVPDFTTKNGAEQKQVAIDAYRLRMRMSYKYDEKATVTPQLSSQSRGGGGGGGKSKKSKEKEEETTGEEVSGSIYDENAFKADIEKGVRSALAEEGPESTKKDLNELISKLGFKQIGISGGGLFGRVRDTYFNLTAPDGTKSENFSLDTEDLPYDEVINFILDNADMEKLTKLYPMKQDEKTEKPAAKPAPKSDNASNFK